MTPPTETRRRNTPLINTATPAHMHEQHQNPSATHREHETQALIDALTANQNVHIYGRRGQGKTHIAVTATQQLRPDTAYINCITHDTEYKLLKKLHNEIVGEPAKDGLHTGDLKERVTGHLTGHNVVILDEVDFHTDLNNTLYWLTDQPEATVTTISSNTGDITAHIDSRTASRIQPFHLHLDDYRQEETAEVLAHWATNEDDLEVTKRAIVRTAMKTNNIAYAKTWLNTAESYVEDVVTAPAVAKTKTQARTVYEDWLLQDFTPHHHIVLEAVYQLTDPVDRQTTTGEVYEQYTDLCAVLGNDARTQRRVGSYIDDLDLLGIIDVTKHHGGSEGKTRAIRLQQV